MRETVKVAPARLLNNREEYENMRLKVTTISLDMFSAKTPRIESIAAESSAVVTQLDRCLSGRVRLYIDYANVRPWSEKLGWHIECRRLKQFLDSFEAVRSVRIYTGTLDGDVKSEEFIAELRDCRYEVRTKPVKIMRLSIDVSSINPQSTALLNQFVRSSLLRKMEIADIEYLNRRLEQFNRNGDLWLEDRKCNFDVEIGRDMLLDHERGEIDTFVLWSGDSDFSEPVSQLLASGKKVVLMATARRISRELAALRDKGLIVFDIQKIRDFICWSREIGISKGDRPKTAPKL
jgi:uncharacterized LabA/DUF88 family protein